ncbi:phosphoglycerate mutase [Rathayibacter sp. AY1C2]|uniref:2,3-bisphosphoglycerate-dependent phosphoglycerate mutase n=1 Tax=unclassified Rathayibacter TaxID=2609250 RepID=UPI000CE8FD1B|nr:MULTISPECIES: 2,3-diphosphoglycerate-dependent phosphoglycerate mutase [unclassified Rathayibacter]PPF21711.1 phosphoglycerate mutase [Rathayibacter sp. AY1A7]PPF54183.1 phosphoglycerate mutase [Rathayibacter sp. AY1C2]
MPAHPPLVLVRHGESTGNADGLFCGVLDVPLTDLGRDEARQAATVLRDASIDPDLILTSTLQRSTESARIIAGALPGRPRIVAAQWRLNERNYGALTGLSTSAVGARYGADAFLEWRRSMDVRPPALSAAAFVQLHRSAAFRGQPAEAMTEMESLRDVVHRLQPLLEERIMPALQEGETVLIVGHGNSLRALRALLEDLGDAAVRDLNIPTGQPYLYDTGPSGTPISRSGRYLDPARADRAAITLAHEGGT